MFYYIDVRIPSIVPLASQADSNVQDLSTLLPSDDLSDSDSIDLLVFVGFSGFVKTSRIDIVHSIIDHKDAQNDSPIISQPFQHSLPIVEGNFFNIGLDHSCKPRPIRTLESAQVSRKLQNLVGVTILLSNPFTLDKIDSSMNHIQICLLALINDRLSTF